jgi:ATP-dependent DNA helicase RecG
MNHNINSNNYLFTPIEYLKGVGPQRAELLKKDLNIFTIYDLLCFYPYRYIDKTKIYFIKEINPELQYVQLKGKISSIELLGQNRGKRLVAKFHDESGTIDLIWFQGIKWIQENIKKDTEYLILGKPSVFNGKYNIAHPEIDLFLETLNMPRAGFKALYHTTEKLKSRGIDSKTIGKMVKMALEGCKGKINETLTDEILEKLNLPSREAAIQHIHFPENSDKLSKAEYRLKFEELFFIQLKIIRQKLYRKKNISGFNFTTIGYYFNEFYKNHLPFELTNAQKRVIKEIRADMGSGKQMNRLLQGDVGCGKTMVALFVMLIAIDNGFQACLMAPTEILATQHWENLHLTLEKLNLKVGLLTGSTKKSVRSKILEAIISGQMNILIGTHALLEDVVKFKNLGLTVIDEQHRFGVAQRAKMWKKNQIPPHVLVMTATPIPRTLAMTLFGDLDVSIIDELPAGRKAVKTMHAFESNRLKINGFIKEQIKQGRQVYIVYPLIEESEAMDYRNLMQGYDIISREFPLPEYKVSIVHGKMKAVDKDFEMQRFVKGETNIMVATTVIEVGVNVTNASVMIIESAERFGLSQLHQLRGRVGRGEYESYCILMTSYKLSAESKQRMETMVRTSDGFEIAEVDLKLRGPGDIEGTRQSGILDLKIADLAKDTAILHLARKYASEMLERDPLLQQEGNSIISQYFETQGDRKVNWSRIS